MLQIQVETGVALLRLLQKALPFSLLPLFLTTQRPLPEMGALHERAFLPALDGHELTAVVPTVTFLVARNRVIMSAPTRVIEQHFVFSILFHTRLINEVCQCRRVFVTAIRNFKSG
jgi:hypothetical protein